MNKRIMFALTLAALLCMLVASGALAGIGVYKVDGGLSVPATIKYMLNKDAESLTVEICPAGPPLGTAVKTWTFAAGAPECAKGLHQNLVWDGTDNSSNPVPAGDYKVKVTATGAAITGSNMVPVWESVGDSSWRLYGSTVNNDRTSVLCGRVYVCNYQTGGGKAKGVYEFEPDGALIGKLPDPAAWGQYSGPWSIAFDADNHLYVSDRSTSKLYQYTYNTATNTWSITSTTSMTTHRAIGCYGSGGAMSTIVTECNTADPPTNSRIYVGTGDPPGAMTTAAFNALHDWFMQPAIDSTGKVYVAGLKSGSGVTPAIGSVSVWTTAGAPVDTVPGSGTNRNTNLTATSGIAITRDGSSAWLGRWASFTGYKDSRDNNAILGYAEANMIVLKFPATEIATINPYDEANPPANFKHYGLGTTSTGYKNPYFITPDAVGNLVLDAGANYQANAAMYFGVYEEPLGVTTTDNMVSFNTIHFSGEPSPVFVSGNAAPASIPADGTTKSMITVVGEDADNTVSYNDIEYCRFHCPELHYGTAGDLTTGVPMNLFSRSGIQNTYKLEISAATDVSAGTYQATVALYDKHANVAVGTGTVAITVTGGVISGRLTNGETGAPCANVTVMAKLGAYERTAVTDADGNYSINVTAGVGYVVSPVKGTDGVTYPSEYNLQSDWPADPGTSDWPKTVDATLGSTVTADGRLWPLAITQVTYDWATSTPRLDNRFVSVIGVVMRAAADSATSQKGFNGYYWIEDTRRAGTLQGLKVLTRSGDPVIKEGDKVVIDGMYMKVTNYVTGRMVPSAAPFVVSSDNAIPAAREMTFANQIGYLTGGIWHIGSTTVVEKDTANIRFRVQIPKASATDTNLGDVWIDLDTDATTGVTLPEVGTLVEITGIIDELGAYGAPRMLRPGKPSDVKSVVFVNSLGEVKGLANQTSIIFDIPVGSPLIVTSAAPYHPTLNLCEWMYVEDSNRVAGIKINGNGLLPASLTIWPGDTVTGRLAGVVQQTAGDYELKINQAPTIVESVDNDTSLVPAPIAVTNLAFGGGWLGGCPAVYDRGYGTNNQGLFGKIYGRVTEIIYETDPFTSEQKPYIVFIDDGAAVKGGMSGNPPAEKTGVKCIVGKATIKAPDGSEFPVWATQPGGLSIGDYVVVTGIIGSEWIQAPVNRQRVLRMRYCYDPNSGPPPVEFYDQFQIIQDVP